MFTALKERDIRFCYKIAKHVDEATEERLWRGTERMSPELMSQHAFCFTSASDDDDDDGDTI
jgi:hypothetical protein